MKRFLFSMLLCSISASLWAQYTLSQNEVPIAADTIIVRKIDAVAFDPGAAGPLIQWDFRNVIDVATDTIWRRVPAGQPGDTAFPTATHHRDFSFTFQGTTIVQSRFQRRDAGALVELGFYQTRRNVGAVFSLPDTALYIEEQVGVYPTPDTLIKFGLDYGDTWQSSPNKASLFGILITDLLAGVPTPYPVRFDRTGSRTIEIDGYGTITTPAGTYHNVLRVVTLEESVDSIFANLGGGFAYAGNFDQRVVPGFVRTKSYQWYVRDTGVVFQYDSIRTQAGTFPPQFQEYAWYRTEFRFTTPADTIPSDTIPSDTDTTNSVRVMPGGANQAYLRGNPVRDYAQLMIQGAAPHSRFTFRVLDLQGREVYSYTLVAPEADTFLMFDLRSLPAGMYTWQLLDDASRATGGKLLLQH